MSKILAFKKDKFEIKAKGNSKAEIVLYGAIGASFWEDSITAKQFSEEMKKIDSSVKEISVRINSPGGDVFDGISIYNRLKQHPAKKTVYIDGLAASIASIIALAGDEIVMGDGALYMIHLPWSVAMGNRNDFENTINRLMDVEEQMVGIYAKKTGMDRSEIRSMLEKETWLNSSEAVEMGFATTVSEDSLPIAASIFDKASWITKRPKCKTQDQVVKNTIKELKEKISAKIARK